MSLLARAGGRRPQLLGRIISSSNIGICDNYDRTVNNSICSSRNSKRGIKSLAFTCYFKHPGLGVTEYEYLSRGTASLLAVDPAPPIADGPYGHLEAAEERRKVRDFKKQHGFTPATGKGKVSDMNWLHFMPREHRPNVHVVTSSHVVSPFLWLDYYPHDWLTQIQQEHCKYTLEVYDTEKPGEVLGTYDLYNTPIHHPEGRDIAFLHIQEEETALKEMKKLGVKPLYMRNPDKLYSKGETIYFDGFLVHADPSELEEASSSSSSSSSSAASSSSSLEDEDTRIFEPYEEIGHLAFHTNDRFFADTATPLPEGLCGAPALDADGELCGVVEGIIPTNHENKKIAGSAAFLPSFVLQAFQDYAERQMLEQLMPKDLFQQCVRARETNQIGGGSARLEGTADEVGPGGWQALYDKQVEELRRKHSKEEADAILWQIKREQREVMRIMNTEGGDLDEVIARVRAETMATRDAVKEAYRKGELNLDDMKEEEEEVDNDEKEGRSSR